MKRFLFVLVIMFAMTAPLAAQVADCGCEDKPLPEILGTINGVKITKQDLSPETRARVEELQKQVVEARGRELDLQIDSILLESEAKKRGVSPSQVIKDDVIAKVQTPTDAEAQAFYDQNKSKIQGEFKDEKNNVIEYLRYQRQQELGGFFLEASGYERPQWYEANAGLLKRYTTPCRDEWSSKFWSPIIGAEALAVRDGVGLFDITTLNALKSLVKVPWNFSSR